MSAQVVVFEKRVGMARFYIWDYTLYDEIANRGETITGAVISASVPAGLTIGAPAIGTGQYAGQVSALINLGGTVGQEYVITCTVTTSGGATLPQDGKIAVVS